MGTQGTGFGRKRRESFLFPVFRWLGLFSAVIVFAVSGSALAAEDEGTGEEGPLQVGNAAKVTRLVKATMGEEVRDIKMLADVYQNELIETGASSAAEIKFLDETKLSLGPNTKVVLDEFVFDPRPNKGKLILSATKGVFRFVSGKLSADAYKVKTPVATMGVRGTAFTVFIKDNGHTTVAVSDGEVRVANLEGLSVIVKPGLSTSVSPPDKSGKAAPPAAPGPLPPEFEEIVGEMDLALEESEEAEEEVEIELAEDEDVEGRDEIEEAAIEVFEEEILPEDVLEELLDGSGGDLEALKEFLAGEGLDPETVAGRAMALLDMLKTLGSRDPEELMRIAEHILQLTTDYFRQAGITDFRHLVLEGLLTFYVGGLVARIETAAGDEIEPVYESEISASPS